MSHGPGQNDDRPQGWTSARAAQRYVRVQAEMVPGRRETLALIAAVAAAQGSGRPAILDLGCGPGEVTAAILARAPGASVTMLDFSDELLGRARQRFGDDGRVSVVKHDLNAGLPAELAARRFDAVVSCFAIHHVAVAARVPLYAAIRAALTPGGVFVDGDRFRAESPALAARELDRWVDWMADRAKAKFGMARPPAEIKRRQLELDESLGDQPRSIWDMRDDLRSAGFAHVDCLYKDQITGVIVALP